MNDLIYNLNNLNLNEIKSVIKIQSWYRGCSFRLKRLPLILYIIQNFLIKTKFNLNNDFNDGRLNSSISEDIIIKLLINKFTDKIKITNIRNWYDILIYDNLIGWFPVNIKITTTKTCDNTGNLAMCVYAYTDLHIDEISLNCKNGEMSTILVSKLQQKLFNLNAKKDYYFIVINKTNTNDIIVNSLKGLDVLTPNINNLPFQICWSRNRLYNYTNINTTINKFIKCIKTSKLSWKEKFLDSIRKL